MFLERILISDFKNISQAELHFSPKINCIWGSNGEGKTNLLDAIHYLSMTKSYFSSSDNFTFKNGTLFTALNGTYNSNTIDSDVKVDNFSIGLKGVKDDSGCVKVEEKQVKKNGKSYSKISEHIGQIPVVMVSPMDTGLIHLTGEERRRFINLILSQIDKEYLKRLQNYNQLLLQRNKFLKMQGGGIDLLETLDERLSINAQYIYEKRKELSYLLNEKVKKYYDYLSSSKEQVVLEYCSHLDEASMEILLKFNYEKDFILKHTSVGIHRDDLVFKIGNMPIKNCGSQGQQKTFLIALKLAQYEIMFNLHGKKPILLLDDVFDKLDMGRVGKLIELVSGSAFGQIFITDSSKVRMESVLEPVREVSKNFTVESGEFREIV